jgi:tetratricopeptide (TPR) repeat protein
VINLNAVQGTPLTEMYSYLDHIPETSTSAVLMEKLAEVYEVQGKLAQSLQALRRALELRPSPQQRVRLTLALVARLTAQGESRQAYDVLRRFLDDAPAYPDRPGLLKDLANRARKLGLDEQAAEYERQIRRLAPPPAAVPAPKS